jgi:hypothetical protein
MLVSLLVKVNRLLDWCLLDFWQIYVLFFLLKLREFATEVLHRV